MVNISLLHFLIISQHHRAIADNAQTPLELLNRIHNYLNGPDSGEMSQIIKCDDGYDASHIDLKINCHSSYNEIIDYTICVI